ncbi:zinc-ribbon domain containing protein [Uliginosibacterium paludis]|uniref:Zinc-ribbon domain containing protein n=1 Tax=Uliginosibacterium paludis TaxID=1615952 RepID=A0ABV2CUC1_9RHOO
MVTRSPPKQVPANPREWSVESQRSVAAEFTRFYTDKHYKCRQCKIDCVFLAVDQKRVYEEKKSNINQQRILCEKCFQRASEINASLLKFQERWAEEKSLLEKNKEFLSQWQSLLLEKDRYIRGHSDEAKKNMLARLIKNA